MSTTKLRHQPVLEQIAFYEDQIRILNHPDAAKKQAILGLGRGELPMYNPITNNPSWHNQEKKKDKSSCVTSSPI